MPEFKEFKDADTLVAVLAAQVADLLRVGIKERGKASLVVSGGSTPVSFFAALSELALDWKKVTISLADERWVEPTDNDSNECLVGSTFCNTRRRQQVSWDSRPGLPPPRKAKKSAPPALPCCPGPLMH